MKKFLIKKGMLLVILFGISMQLNAQKLFVVDDSGNDGSVFIIGSNNTNVNEIISYKGLTIGGTVVSVIWSVSSGGVIQSQNTTGVTIKWVSPGNQLITYQAITTNGSINATFAVIVNGSGTGTIPSTPPVGTQLDATENFTYNVSYLQAFDEGDLNNSDGSTKISSEDMLQSITYFDGLGRPKQQVGIRQSPVNNQDIITNIEYDNFGRQVKDYLPYTHSYLDYGKFRNDAKSQTEEYYKANFATEINTTNPNPYSEKVMENSPLGRVFEQGAPGYDWRVTGNTVKFDYDTNTDSEVKIYYVSTVFNGNTYIPTLEGGLLDYPKTQLYKTVTKDENWTSGNNHTTEEFKNKNGQIILKRTYGDSKVNGATQYGVAHDTYYVYDNFGNLTYVLPPKAEANENKPSVTELNDLCYQYAYDHRNRLVEKKIPGKGVEFIVYDNLDRPVLTQDPNLRATQDWLFTKYDKLGRVAYTGMYHNGSTRLTIQPLFEDDLAENMYEERTTSIITVDQYRLYYTNKSYPNDASNLVIYTINYYDDYNFDLAGSELPESIYSKIPTTNVKGLPTGTKVRVLTADAKGVLTTSDWITSLTYYDTIHRPIYSYTHNDYLQTTDKIKSKLDFTGKVLKTNSVHSIKLKDTLTIIIDDVFTYDQQGRLLKQTQEINNNTVLETIVENQYDKMGQLVSKGVGGKDSNANRLQAVDYKYNIRGWLTNINDVSDFGTDLFASRLNYNVVDPLLGGVKLYNGNISQTLWKTSNDNKLRSYGYNYDALNRIKSASYKATSEADRYSLNNINYDKNGNILSLQRQGHVVANPTLGSSSHFGNMDDLSYYYNGNQLHSVTDNGNDTYGFKDGNTSDSTFSNGNGDDDDDFKYDANGNMIKDANKGIISISYNHLNLPIEVKFPEHSDWGIEVVGNKIKYVYDATGNKLEKVIYTTGFYGYTKVHTAYAGNYIYNKTVEPAGLPNPNNPNPEPPVYKFQFFNHAEGYVKNENGIFNYIYQYKDHLGNVRLSYSDNDGNGTITSSTEIVEESNYYPFGLKHKGYNNVHNGGNSVAQKFMFGGKEFQDELGLDMYDYGARNYDPSLGRWFGIDELAEDYHSSSPYGFVGNNPITNMEIDGRFWIRTVGEDGSVTYEAENGDSASSLYKQFGEKDGFTANQANQMIIDIFGKNRVVDGEEFSNVDPKDTITVFDDTKPEETTTTEETVEEVKPLVDPKAYLNPNLDFTGVNAQLDALATYRSYDDPVEGFWAYIGAQQSINRSEIASGMQSATGGKTGGVRGTRKGVKSTRVKRVKPQTVKVSGQTKTVQTGSQGGKYYINKNGNKSYLNRDGTKRN